MKPQHIAPAEKLTPTPVDPAIDEVLEEVAVDANEQPERYLDDSEVPEGGE